MEYRPLGRTGIDVSVIGLGTMTWGEQNTAADAHAQLDRAVAAGVNLIDTAEMYPVPPRAETYAETERILGQWLARQPRDRLVVATKAAGPGDWATYIRGGPRLTAAHLREALDASLARLQTDYVDLYQLHWPERRTNFFGRLGYAPAPDEDAVPLEETLRALDDLVRAGKVRAIGVSNETPWGVMRLLCAAEREGLPRLASIQNPYNLLNRTFEVGLAEVAHREQAGLLAYSPLGFGMLSGKYLHGARPEGARLTRFERFKRYTNPQAIAATERYVGIAREHGLDPAQMALAFVNRQPFTASTLIGATTMEQLERNLGSAEVVLPEPVLTAIEQVHREQPNPAP